MRRYIRWLSAKDLALALSVNFVLVVGLSLAVYQIGGKSIRLVMANPTTLWPIGFFGLLGMAIIVLAPRPGGSEWQL